MNKIFLFTLLFGSNALAGDNQSPPDLSCYPPVKGFLACIALHTNASWNLQHTNFLLLSEYYRMDCLGCDVLQYSVSESGQVFDYHDPGDGSILQPRRQQLLPADLTKLRLAVSELPSTNQRPWLASLVIVSHRDGTNWVTHTYARTSNEAAEAPALRHIFDLIGERPEAHE